MTTPTSENQYLSIIGGVTGRSSSIAHDDDGLISDDSFELNWASIDEFTTAETTTTTTTGEGGETEIQAVRGFVTAETDTEESTIIYNIDQGFKDAYSLFTSDAPGDFVGSMTIYSEVVAKDDDSGEYYYLYESINTTGDTDPTYTVSSKTKSIYRVNYTDNEKTAFQDRFVGDFDSISTTITSAFEEMVLTAVSSSNRSANRYTFTKRKEPILTTKNVSALVTGSARGTMATTPTAAGTTPTAAGTTTSY